MGEQAILPSFDPLSVYYAQLYTMQRAEDAYANASAALNAASKAVTILNKSYFFCPDDGMYYPVRVRNVGGNVYSEIGDPVVTPI